MDNKKIANNERLLSYLDDRLNVYYGLEFKHLYWSTIKTIKNEIWKIIGK